MKPLNDYIREVRDKEFKWGVFDCLIFTNEAWHRMYGEGWADDWVGGYMKETPYGKRVMRKEELQSKFGYFSFDQAANSKLRRIHHIPPKGSLVATKGIERRGIGYALGISLGAKAVFLSHQGLVYYPISSIEKAWVRL